MNYWFVRLRYTDATGSYVVTTTRKGLSAYDAIGYVMEKFNVEASRVTEVDSKLATASQVDLAATIAHDGPH